jgi:pilus assembly protein CpaE
MHFKELSTEAGGRVNTGLFLTDPEFMKKIRPLFESGGLGVSVARQIDGTESIDRISTSELNGLGVAVFDLANNQEPIGAAREAVDRCRSDTAVVVLGRINDVSFYRDLKSVGVSEYFTHPVQADELVTSVRRLAGLMGGDRKRRGLMVAVHGVHGGLGAGLLTAGMGAFMSDLYGRETVLVDSDLAAPSVGGYLGVDVPANLQILLEAGERLDWVLIRQALQSPLERLGLLAGQVPIGARTVFDDAALARLGRILEDRYRYQIWRSQAGCGHRGAVLGAADLVILLMGGSFPCVRVGQLTLAWLAEHNPSARVVVVYNQVSPAPSFQAANLSKFLGLEISHVIHYSKRLGEQLVAGLPFTRKNHCLHKSLSMVTRDIMGRISEENAFI